MFLKKSVFVLFISLFFVISSGASDILLNGTNIYLATGGSRTLYQGYALNLKSVSSDGSIWLQLTNNDTIVKSEIVANKGYFIYNKTNNTIISVKLSEIYSGSAEQDLAELSVHQFLDPELPTPNKTGMVSSELQNPDNNITSPVMHTLQEPVIWLLGIILVIVLFYIIRRLW